MIYDFKISHRFTDLIMKYSKQNYPLQKESYQIIGICMEVHRNLGKGF